MSTQTQDNLNALMLILNQVKRIDMRIAMDIAGLGNCAVRDHNGNLLPFVWTRQSFNNEHENASLLTRDVLQKHLSGFIEANVAENISMLQKVGDPALLVDWLVRTTEHWERRYAQKRDEKYDISQAVTAAMLETIIDQVIPTLESYYPTALQNIQTRLEQNFDNLEKKPNDDKFYARMLRLVSAEARDANEQNLESFFWLHRHQHAIMRLLFRIGLRVHNSNPDAQQQTDTGHGSMVAHVGMRRDNQILPTFLQHICMMTGKLLQKKEVCNKAGAYSSLRQRSDVLQEFNNVVINFRMWLETTNCDALFDQINAILSQESWIFYVIDHTSVPVTFSHIHKATVHQAHTLFPNTSQHITCPHCQHLFTPSQVHTDPAHEDEQHEDQLI